MNRTPDLSAFKIARKGAARPIEADPAGAALLPMPEPAPEATSPVPIPPVPTPAVPTSPVPAPPLSGRLLATTVKLDEALYLRLQEAARPVPGRPRRRTTQDILTEALDEWLARRGL